VIRLLTSLATLGYDGGCGCGRSTRVRAGLDAAAGFCRQAVPAPLRRFARQLGRGSWVGRIFHTVHAVVRVSLVCPRRDFPPETGKVSESIWADAFRLHFALARARGAIFFNHFGWIVCGSQPCGC